MFRKASTFSNDFVDFKACKKRTEKYFCVQEDEKRSTNFFLKVFKLGFDFENSLQSKLKKF